jgi:hypothetical protein
LPISVENLSNFDEGSGSDIIQEVQNASIIDAGEYVPTSIEDAPENIDRETGEIING